MTTLNLLTKKRKSFLNQIYNIVDNQFKKQEEDFKEKDVDKIIEMLENNSDYIQRIFIDGSWGTGKSYFCEALKEKINEENKKKEKERKINFIKINTWETDYFSDPMKSLIGEISSHITLNVETTQKAEQILKNGLTIFGKAVLNKGLEKIGLDKANREELVSLFKEVTQFETSELDEYNKYKQLVNDFKETLITKEPDLKLIVIDELDRCKPSYAIELLETIKHFFGVKNIIFIFLVNMEQLRSIASTSYLTEDKCSEYFEKFYDIKFSLPSLDYNDFIQIEYDKYNQLDIYKPYKSNKIDMDYFSNEVDRFYEALFLEAFNSNCDGESVAPRSFIKSFRKFSILLLSLSRKEKSCYPLMIVLILYFIREEFLLKYKKDQEYGDNKPTILLLYLRTFFEKKNLTQFENILEEYEFEDSFIGNKIRGKFQFNNFYFYKKLYLILLYEVGIEIVLHGNNVPTEFITLSNNYNEDYKDNINYLLFSNKITFNNIEYVYNEDRFYGNRLVLPLNLFQEINKETFKVSTYNYIYNTAILEAWAKEKYSFVLNI
ncbi:KAP family P-loop NTPase fold protein [Fusobacterium sp.]|uniref:KAP family P-loop NTPase fold protein n=1 Tax=Fusobacterium sp. TaxID=68766 RepID=UPI000C700612|nr:P-loop NTPase fold protein [Fusobacterium sp.]